MRHASLTQAGAQHRRKPGNAHTDFLEPAADQRRRADGTDRSLESVASEVDANATIVSPDAILYQPTARGTYAEHDTASLHSSGRPLMVPWTPRTASCLATEWLGVESAGQLREHSSAPVSTSCGAPPDFARFPNVLKWQAEARSRDAKPEPMLE
jgi:hypothetical protein